MNWFISSALYFFISVNLFSQEIPVNDTQVPVDQQGQQLQSVVNNDDTAEQSIVDSPQSTSNLLTELGTLKIKYFSNDLTLEELYRLASFYLVEQNYQQASELYGQYINRNVDLISKERLSSAYYNRALSLFALELYSSALPLFMDSFSSNPEQKDALRMAGTIYFLQQDKDNSLKIWTQYLSETPNTSPYKKAIQDAVNLISDPSFSFAPESTDTQDSTETNNQTWPFLNPETLPNPDAQFQRKRVI